MCCSLSPWGCEAHWIASPAYRRSQLMSPMKADKDRLPVRLRLRPGQNGTEKLVEKYGDRLVAVRYRYDEYTGTRLKTVELVEETQPWSPSERRAKTPCQSGEPAPSDRFGVRVGYNEVELRDRVKQVGGIWRPEDRMWELTYAQIQAMGLEERIVQGG
jgi:hypothetical protein